MATAREHLAATHKVIAAHHRSMSECHSAALDKETVGTHQHDFHKAAAAAHDQDADAHDAMYAECSKAADGDLTKADAVAPSGLEGAIRKVFLEMFGNTLQPTNVSAIAPTAPGFGIRSVPRVGQREIPTATVPVELSKIVGLSEEDQHGEERSLR